MKKIPFAQKLILLILASEVAFSNPAFSISKRKKITQDAAESENTATEVVVEKEDKKDSGKDKETSVKLTASSKKRTFFYKVNESVLSGVEKGSPASIKTAMELLRKAESDYTDAERVLVKVSAFVYETVWQSEKISWEVFSAKEDNPYMGAISSVQKGVFDTSTGNVDFLSTLLPALVMFTSNSTQNVLPSCKEALDGASTYNPESVLLNYLYGIYFTKVTDFEKAEIYFKKAYDQAGDSQEISLEYSKVLTKNGKANLATTVIAGISEKNPNDINILKQNAYVSFERKDYTAAEDYVARVLQQTPNDLEFVLFRARIFIEKNDYIHAVSLLDMYSRQNNTDLGYLILRARVQLDWSKNTTAATETIEKALQLYPDSEEALMIAAKISASTDSPVAGKYADELSAIVLQKNPENSEASLYALNGLIQRENWNEAYDISKELCKKNPENSDIVMNHVTVCLKLGKKTEALEVASYAYNAKPDDELITQSYIYAYSEAKSREESLALINSVLNNASSKMKSYLYYRRSFLQRTEENTLADLRSSLIANPRNSDALFRLYEVYFAKEDYRKAQYYLRQVVAINPNDSSYRKLNEALTQLIK